VGSEDSETIVVDTPLVGRYALLGADEHLRRTFLAIDRQSKEAVSVELLPDDGFVASTAIELYRRGLSHRNLVALHDIDIVSETPYVAMEPLSGVTLREYLAAEGGRLSLQVFVPIAAQIVKGVGFVHANGFALGGIGPQRILLSQEEGRENFVKLLPCWRDPAHRPDQHDDVRALGDLLKTLLVGPELALDAWWWREADDDVPRALLELVEDCSDAPSDRSPRDANALAGRLIKSVPARLFRLRKTDETPVMEN
jgi:serine/threonine protein kinase